MATAWDILSSHETRNEIGGLYQLLPGSRIGRHQLDDSHYELLEFRIQGFVFERSGKIRHVRLTFAIYRSLDKRESRGRVKRNRHFPTQSCYTHASRLTFIFAERNPELNGRATMTPNDYHVLIPNWNGADVIERCLVSVMAGLRRIDRGVQVTVVDDASTDGSAEQIAERFSQVELLRLSSNVGFARAVNEGMASVTSPWVFLLNNDLVVQADFFERLLNAKGSVDDADVFSISARTVDWGSGEPNHTGFHARWSRGMIVQEAFDSEGLARTDFIQAGACLMNRDKFFKLGRFSDLYAPGYWEDYDLAYQARRRNWVNYYEPRALGHHWGKRSMVSRFGHQGVDLLIKRNHLLFNWVNLSDRRMLYRHLAGLGALIARGEDAGNSSSATWGRAFLAAMPRLPMVLRERRRRAQATSLSDRDVLFTEEKQK